MDVEKILRLLHEERTRIENAILALETLEAGSRKRRGRPPKWIVAARRRMDAPREPRPEEDGSRGA